MSFVVYYLEDEIPNAVEFGDKEMTLALQEVNSLRSKPNIRHVVMSSANSDMVGKLGVDAIKDGKTPDGQDYDWSKAGRAGRVRRHEASVAVKRNDSNS